MKKQNTCSCFLPAASRAWRSVCKSWAGAEAGVVSDADSSADPRRSAAMGTAADEIVRSTMLLWIERKVSRCEGLLHEDGHRQPTNLAILLAGP